MSTKSKHTAPTKNTASVDVPVKEQAEEKIDTSKTTKKVTQASTETASPPKTEEKKATVVSPSNPVSSKTEAPKKVYHPDAVDDEPVKPAPVKILPRPSPPKEEPVKEKYKGIGTPPGSPRKTEEPEEEEPIAAVVRQPQSVRGGRGRGMPRGRGRGGRGGFVPKDDTRSPPRSDDEKAPRGRGGFRGRGRGAPNHQVRFKVVSHTSNEQWVRYQTSMQQGVRHHFIFLISPLQCEKKEAHPQMDEITATECYSVNGRRGAPIFLERGCTYNLSLRGPDQSTRRLVFTASAVGGKQRPVLPGFPQLQTNQSMWLEVTDSFPDFFYYQDATDRFLGGPVIVTNKAKPVIHGRTHAHNQTDDETLSTSYSK